MRLELGAAYGRDWDRVAQDVVERHFLNAFATGDYVRGLDLGHRAATIERIVMPFREGGRPPGGRRARLADRDRLRCRLPSGHVAQPDRRPAGAPAQLPAMRPPGAEPDARDPDRATGPAGAGERIQPAPIAISRTATSFHIPRRRILIWRLFRRRTLGRRRRVGALVGSGDLGHRNGRLPADQARAASPNARNSGRLTGSCAARYSGCHCTDRVKPGAPST
jgi:hypothetical protein